MEERGDEVGGEKDEEMRVERRDHGHGWMNGGIP